MLKARLTALLAALGELPPEMVAGGTGGTAGQGFSRLLEEICPVGTLVLHDKNLPGGPDIRHLVVAPRGLVVVAPEWAPARLGPPRRGLPAAPSGTMAAGPSSPAAPAGGPKGLWGRPVPEPRWRRSQVVRGTLRRAHALGGWLESSAWAGTPVLAAACTSPSIGAPPAPPVMMEDLWVGPVERLGPWLASGGRLSPADQAVLAHFLTEALSPA